MKAHTGLKTHNGGRTTEWKINRVLEEGVGGGTAGCGGLEEIGMRSQTVEDEGALEEMYMTETLRGYSVTMETTTKKRPEQKGPRQFTEA